MTSTFSYTNQQQEAMERIKEFLISDASVFILKGYAGTGKTTLIRPIIELAWSAGKDVQLMAPTGRAAKILSEKAGRGATTIHKGIYEFTDVEAVEGNESNESKIEYFFPLKQRCDRKRPGGPKHPSETLIIIDEASMISSRKESTDLFLFGTGVLLNDILSYSNVHEGGKILFVGDPAQLPPVGDNNSCALDEAWMANNGLCVVSYELSDVVRQKSDNVILSNSAKLRAMIGNPVKTNLILDRKAGEVEDIKAEDVPNAFCSMPQAQQMDGPVVICYSNKTAAAYNRRIREYFFPGKDTIQKGDKVIIVGNNYSQQGRVVLNGEFAIVTDVCDHVETQTGVIYVEKGGEKKERISLTLAFREVELLFNDGKRTQSMVFDSLLDSERPNITYQEQCALMSNFSMRHRNLKEGTPEYIEALLSDPFYNALRIKYGYAITCHKSQGGEWDTTFVDFRGRIGLNNDSLRWSYTAATRARRQMFGVCLHNIPTMKAKVTEISAVSSVPSEYFPEGRELPMGPFSSGMEPVAVRARYFVVKSSLEGTPYHVSAIEHKPYREIYTITDADKNEYRFDSTYNKAGIMKPFIPQRAEETPEDLAMIMASESSVCIPFSYTPSNKNLEDLYSRIASLCDDNDITFTNIVEHLNSYKVSYYLKTDAAFAYLDVCVNKYGQTTYISPRSADGPRDQKLVALIEGLK